MDYEDSPKVIKPSKGAPKSMLKKAAGQLGTPTLLWLIVRRHKNGLMLFWAISITTVWLFPAVPDLILSSLKSL